MRRSHFSHLPKVFIATAAILLLGSGVAWANGWGGGHGGGGRGGGGWHGGYGGWHGGYGGWHGGYGGWRGGYGGWRGGWGGWRGGWGGWGGWGWGGIGVGFANPWLWGWPYYGYPGYYPPAAYAYDTPAPVVQQVPMSSAAPPSWYYCDNPAGYYPYVQSCANPWRQVPATPPPPPAAQH